MLSQKQLGSIFARTGLAPPSAFLEAAEAMRLDIPSVFVALVLAKACSGSGHRVDQPLPSTQCQTQLPKPERAVV